MSRPSITISLDSPFTLRELEYLLSDARNNGIELDEEVEITHIHEPGQYDDRITYDGYPMPILKTRLSLRVED